MSFMTRLLSCFISNTFSGMSKSSFSLISFSLGERKYLPLGFKSLLFGCVVTTVHDVGQGMLFGGVRQVTKWHFFSC